MCTFYARNNSYAPYIYEMEDKKRRTLMNNVLTFIIPVRHQDNAIDWGCLKNNLIETIRSIEAQENKAWRAIIVANSGADLPKLPSRFEVKWVDYPLNMLHEQGDAKLEEFRNALRMDKGRRVLAGLRLVEEGHVMIVDDDDFVSRKLTAFVAMNQENNGWYFLDGYVWQDRGKLIYPYRDFSKLCGTSHIIRRDLWKIPGNSEEISDNYIKKMLGSHIFIKEYLQDGGTQLEALPFHGAIYRFAHVNSHSKSNGLVKSFIFNRNLARNPVDVIKRFIKIRFITKSIRAEFFGYNV